MTYVYAWILPFALPLGDGGEGYPIEPQLDKVTQWQSLGIKASLGQNNILDPIGF